MSTVTETSLQALIDQVVDGVPGVIGAVIASVDGFVLAARLPDDPALDPSAIAAMSAATLGLASRMVQLAGTASALTTVHRSPQAQVCVFAVGEAAVLTIVAEARADTQLIDRVGYEVSWGLVRTLQPETPA